ncbi:unnamed protein product [Penicillium glandicola]
MTFRVIIVGGGVAGLTLASAFEKAGIDYVLLERRPAFNDAVGASIALTPNGARVLDQLGAWGKWLEIAQPLVRWGDRNSKGELIMPRSASTPLTKALTGYEMTFGLRRSLLQTLYDNIEDKSMLLLEKSVINVTHSKEGITVQSSDGCSYEGDILVGADGTYSKVREYMWRFADDDDPELMDLDKTAMTAEYQCLFGISKASGSVAIGDADFIYDHDRSAIIFSDNCDHIYYFILQKMDRVYKMAEIPRFSQADAQSYAQRHADIQIQPDLTFGKLYERSECSFLVALEEAKFKHWYWGRIVCVGDSIHKMTPNLGAGASAAIESAAALLNSIKAMLDHSPVEGPTEAHIREFFAQYQKSRIVRATAVVDVSSMITRLHALKGWFEVLFVRLGMPIMGSSVADMASEIWVGATMLENLAPPRASLRGTLPFNPTQGQGQQESKLKRGLLGLPFLVLLFVAKIATDAKCASALRYHIWESGDMASAMGSAMGSVPLLRRFYSMKGVGDLWFLRYINYLPAFYEKSSESLSQEISSSIDVGIVMSIWLFESIRRANSLTMAQIPTLFTFYGQLVGLGRVSTLYYILHYINSPIEVFKGADMRLMHLNYAISILPAMIFSYYIPLLATFFWPTVSGRKSWLFVWQMHPIWTSITLSLFSRIFPSTIKEDRVHAPRRDLPVIKFSIKFLVSGAVGFWLWARWTSMSSVAHVMIPTVVPSTQASFAACVCSILKWDTLSTFASTFLWLGYLIWDLKCAGMMQAAWVRVAIYGAVAFVALGPGAAVGLCWLWRENILAHKRHKDAVTEENLGHAR